LDSPLKIENKYSVHLKMTVVSGAASFVESSIGGLAFDIHHETLKELVGIDRLVSSKTAQFIRQPSYKNPAQFAAGFDRLILSATVCFLKSPINKNIQFGR
jgi:hypothetical protein